ncbi:MAG: deaminase [Proteobacteria bacterium]|nr:MAG: deaminase [Pseudomonadota bacterium]
MGKLSYVSIMSLDGYIGDGHYDWSLPVEGSTSFISEMMRPIGTYLYGRRNFETMSYWEAPDVSNLSAESIEFMKIWQAADKIVFSKTLKTVTTQRTRLENEFDVEKIRELKKNSDRDLWIGGPNLASQALENKLVDEIHLFVIPTTISNEIPVIPVLPRGQALRLELIEEKRFCGSWVYLRYRVRD